MSKDLIEFLSKLEDIHVNNTEKSVPYTINFSVKGVSSKRIVDLLDKHEIYVSSKTSCCPVEIPSKLVYALTKDKNLASTSLRVSISHLTTDEEIEKFLKIFDECIEELKNNGKI
jgi:cysteine desulfurase